MNRQRHIRIFDRIAPVYGLFFGRQVNIYQTAIQRYGERYFKSIETVLDIGCGTGALAYVLAMRGLKVTGIDGSERMIRLAERFNKQTDACFAVVDVLTDDAARKSTQPDDQYDLVVASYVLHGLDPAARSLLYTYMRKKARKLVIIMDYNQKRGLLTSLIERLEGGDYFNFIQQINQEMQQHFPRVHTIQTGRRAAWYLCFCDAQ